MVVETAMAGVETVAVAGWVAVESVEEEKEAVAAVPTAARAMGVVAVVMAVAEKEMAGGWTVVAEMVVEMRGAVATGMVVVMVMAEAGKVVAKMAVGEMAVE